MNNSLIIFLAFLVLLGTVPVFVLFFQTLLIGVHGIKNHYVQCKEYTPKVAIIIPVWNEEDVIGSSIESLMQLDYPAEQFRIYAVDDVSNDRTPEVIEKKRKKYPEHVINIRRTEKIDFGKAAVINHGLKYILQESWAEAIMIMDADVQFEAATLQRMTRHLADPTVQAVTAYIREGQTNGNLIADFIGFEYIIAQAGARRAQNVLGTMACLAGGAQLHTLKNIIELGGRIDTSTLAEDTFTTLSTQLNGHRVVFDGNAIALAEEPDCVHDLWKQRYRWAEGNVQITRRFKNIWFHRNAPEGLGGIFFGLIWFSTLMMPLCMVFTSIGLNALYLIDFRLSWFFFRAFASVSLVSCLFTSIFSIFIDSKTAKRTWLAGLLFPGLISIAHMFISILPHQAQCLIDYCLKDFSFRVDSGYFLIWVNTWISLCMFMAWVTYRLDRLSVSKTLTNILLLLVGYGPLLCAITFSAYSSVVMKRPMKWNKTIKTGKVKETIRLTASDYEFKKTLKLDKQSELRLFFYEIFLIVVLLVSVLGGIYCNCYQ